MSVLISEKYTAWKAECEEYPPVALRQPPFQGGLGVRGASPERGGGREAAGGVPPGR